MEVDETMCPKCSKQYSENNPPRLLTMCGHTLCQKCITLLIPNKKIASHKYRIVCPLDKTSGEIPTSSPTCFPKNISIINLVAKKKEAALSKNRISDIAYIKQVDSSQSIDFIQNIRQNLQQSSLSISYQGEILGLLDEQFHPQTCLLHQKPLDIVCTRDCKRICASCVIFGEHRGHKVKNAAEVAIIEGKIKKRFQQIIFQCKNIFNNFSNKQTFQKVEKTILQKKQDLEKIIKKKFKDLEESILLAEKKALTKMQRKIEEVTSKLQMHYDEKKRVKSSYGEWQDKIAEKLEILHGNNEQEKIKVIFKSGNFMETSSAIVQNLEKMNLQLFDEADQALDGLTVIFDQDELGRVLKQYCKIEQFHNSFMDVTENKRNLTTILPEESLLDEDISLVKSAEFQFKNNSVIKKQKPAFKAPLSSQIHNSNKTSRIKSNNKTRAFCSPAPKNNKSELSNTVHISSSKSLAIQNSKLKNPIPEKFEKTIQAVTNNETDILDLTNGQLGNEKILQILKLIGPHPVSILKLGRNKISDEGFTKFQPYFNHIVMLNLSRNQLTDRTFDLILSWKKQGKLPNLKSLILGQNKIVQRKHRSIIEQMKGRGLNICI